jgi:hypothetical protein
MPLKRITTKRKFRKNKSLKRKPRKTNRNFRKTKRSKLTRRRLRGGMIPNAEEEGFEKLKSKLKGVGKLYHNIWEVVKNDLVQNGDLKDLKLDENEKILTLDKAWVDTIEVIIDNKKKIILEQKNKLSLLENAHISIKGRIELFKKMHTTAADKEPFISCVEEDDYFPFIHQSEETIDGNRQRGKFTQFVNGTGIYGTINMGTSEKVSNVGFIRQVKNVVSGTFSKTAWTLGERSSPIAEDNTGVLGLKKDSPANNIKMGYTNIPKGSLARVELGKLGLPIGSGEAEQLDKTFFIRPKDNAFWGDGVTIYYSDTFTLIPEQSKCGGGDVDPYVLACFKVEDGGEAFYVLSTHLESGRGEFGKEKTRIDGLSGILSTVNADKIPNLIICMDGNTVPYKEILKKYYPDEDSPVVGMIDTLMGEGEKYKMCVSKDDGATKEHVTPVDTNYVYSVNKRRGYGTNQSSKLGEQEYHLIDYMCYKSTGDTGLTCTKLAKLPICNDGVKIGEYVDTKNLIPSGYKVDGAPITDSLFSTDSVLTRLLNMSGEKKKSLKWFSDHLPLVAEMKFGQTTFILSQLNALANGLAFDGFEAPSAQGEQSLPLPPSRAPPHPPQV